MGTLSPGFLGPGTQENILQWPSGVFFLPERFEFVGPLYNGHEAHCYAFNKSPGPRFEVMTQNILSGQLGHKNIKCGFKQ